MGVSCPNQLAPSLEGIRLDEELCSKRSNGLKTVQGSSPWPSAERRVDAMLKRWFNWWFPSWRLCLKPWCLRGQTYYSRCYKHQRPWP